MIINNTLFNIRKFLIGVYVKCKPVLLFRLSSLKLFINSSSEDFLSKNLKIYIFVDKKVDNANK
jgi:hypothetical protein